MEIINPSTVVGVSTYKMTIQNATLNKYNHNLIDFLAKMEEDYQAILAAVETHDNYLLHMFNALETSKNTKFLTWIGNQRTDWETGEKTFTPDSLSDAATKIFVNMKETKTWKQKEPEDSQIVALTTKLAAGEEKLANSTALVTDFSNAPANGKGRIGGKGGKTGSDKDNNNQNKNHEIAYWRKKKGPDHKTVDGKDWWWCPNHKGKDGKEYDGLYITHKPDECHLPWNQRSTHYAKCDQTAASSDIDTSSNKKLTLSKSIKSALTANCDMSAKEASNLVSSILKDAGQSEN